LPSETTNAVVAEQKESGKEGKSRKIGKRKKGYCKGVRGKKAERDFTPRMTGAGMSSLDDHGKIVVRKYKDAGGGALKIQLARWGGGKRGFGKVPSRTNGDSGKGNSRGHHVPRHRTKEKKESG